MHSNVIAEYIVFMNISKLHILSSVHEALEFYLLLIAPWTVLVFTVQCSASCFKECNYALYCYYHVDCSVE
jgi:hypothetical protein